LLQLPEIKKIGNAKFSKPKNMGISKFNGDTKTGRLLQKKADEKRDRKEIAAYLSLDLEGLNKNQRRNKLLDLAEKHSKD